MNKKVYVGIFIISFALIAVSMLSLSQVKAEDNNSSSSVSGSAPGTIGSSLISPSATTPVQGSVDQNKENKEDYKTRLSGQPPEGTQLSVSINSQGQTNLNNVSVTAVNGNILTVSIFGLNFSVDQSGTSITGIYVLPPMPSTSVNATNSATSFGSSSQTASISVGDKISIIGSIDQSTGIIKASQISNLSKETQSTNDIKARLDQLFQMLNQLRAQLGL